MTAEEGLEFAKKHNMVFQEVSAKTGENIMTLFNNLAAELAKNKLNNTTMVSDVPQGEFIAEKKVADLKLI